MRRLREETETSHENSERWLLTYSDVITLLLALFIILYGMSTVDYKKIEAVSDSFQSRMSTKEKVKIKDDNKEQIEKADEFMVPADMDLFAAYEALKDYIANNKIEDVLEVIKTNSYLKLTLADSALFAPNSATMLNPDVVREIASVVAKIYPNIKHVTISGHTADTGSSDMYTERNAWQLSVDRAIAVLNVLTENMVLPDKISIEGRSHYDPVTPNDTEEGRARNRRVEITIT
jgi:chemotaxis protein MotB